MCLLRPLDASSSIDWPLSLKQYQTPSLQAVVLIWPRFWICMMLVPWKDQARPSTHHDASTVAVMHQ